MSSSFSFFVLALLCLLLFVSGRRRSFAVDPHDPCNADCSNPAAVRVRKFYNCPCTNAEANDLAGPSDILNDRKIWKAAAEVRGEKFHEGAWTGADERNQKRKRKRRQREENQLEYYNAEQSQWGEGDNQVES
jgi:hypothetical protein